jgi:nucleotide-binding universal stress UspA family protein
MGGVRSVDHTLDAELADTVERELEATAEGLRSDGLEVTAFTLAGDVVTTLAGHVNSVRARLVVMTTHGRSGWRRAVLGSVADALVRTVDSAVYAVPAPNGEALAVREAPVPMVLPLDGSEQDDSALDLAELARQAFDARLMLLNVIKPVEDKSRQPVQQVDRVDLRDRRAEISAYLDRVSVLLGAPDTPVEHDTVIDDNAAEGILRYAERKEIGHLALVTKGQRGLGKWLIGSVADRLLSDGRMALLLVRGTP